MKNKKLMYGLLFIGALAGVYFWNKNKKSSVCTNCGGAKPKSSPLDENYSNISAGGKYCVVCERPDKTTYFAIQGSCYPGTTCISSRTAGSSTSGEM